LDPTIAVYPGTFDPITNGHQDLIRRASALFTRVHVLVAADTKKVPLFPVEERVEMVREAVRELGNITVDAFRGLLVDQVKARHARVILRGLRAVSDFEYEQQMALMNRRLYPDLETFFMVSDERFSYLSSSFVREIGSLGGDVASMVPPGVGRRLADRFAMKPAPRF